MFIVSRSTRSNKHFALSDMDEFLVVKKEGKSAAVGKSAAPLKMITGGRKRKSDVEVIDVEVFDGMDPMEVKKKVDLMMQSLTSHFVSCIEAERKTGQEAKEKEEFVGMMNKRLQIENSKLSKELADRDRRSEEEAREVMNGARLSAVVAILQARLQMVEDIEAGKQDDWDVESWQQSLERLKGEMGEDVIGDKPVKKAKKVEKKKESEVQVIGEDAGENAGEDVDGNADEKADEDEAGEGKKKKNGDSS